MDFVNQGVGNLTLQEINDQDYSNVPLDLSIIFIVISTVLYGLRLVSRTVQRVQFNLDDYIMLAAYVVQMAMNGASIASAYYGSGRHWMHVMYETPWDFTYWGIYDLYVTAYLYCFAVTLPKLSVLTLYLHVFANRFSRWCCWVIIFVLVANLVVEVITISTQCNHFEYAWELWLQPGNCDNVTAHYTWSSLPNIITDIAMLLLPLPTIWKLQIERHVKVGLWLTLIPASFGMITGVLRFVSFLEYNIAWDGTWYAGILLVFIVLETNMYFISACLLTYRPLLNWLCVKLGLSTMVSRFSGHSSRSKPNTIELPPKVRRSFLHPISDLESGAQTQVESPGIIPPLPIHLPWSEKDPDLSPSPITTKRWDLENIHGAMSPTADLQGQSWLRRSVSTDCERYGG